MEGGERVALHNSSGWKKSVDTVSILVVDDDTTCLSIVAAILKKFKYEVVTVKHPSDALCTLRIKGGAFDLVVSDVHMPDMNGFELQQAVAQEFNLPVILMSADDQEGVALKGLESGAAFFILKPVCADDLRDIWQFAAMKRKSSQVFIEEAAGSFPEEKTLTEKNVSDEIAVSATSVNEDMVNKKDSKRKSPRKEGSDEKKGENSQSGSTKKPKVIWTNSLHNRFLEAIRSIGLDRAVPKKILEVMNVPGLTRENVASHLQKYRIFLRRVSDASYKIQYSGDNGLSRNFVSTTESSGTSPPSTLTLNRFSNHHYQNPAKFPATDAHVAPLPNLEAPSSSLITQSAGFGQSRFLSNRASWPKPNLGSPSLMVHQKDRPYARLAQTSYQTGPSIQGHLANISPEDISRAPSASLDAFPNTSYDIPSQKNVGTPDIMSSLPTKNFTYQSNYVGYSISNIKHLTGSGHSEKYEDLNSFAGTMNLPGDEIQTNSTTVPASLPVPNDNTSLDHQFAQPVGTCNSVVAHNNVGEQLSDLIAGYRMLLSSDPPLVSGVENGGENHESASNANFDLSEFDILSTQQSVDGGGLGTTFVDQLNIPNQAQQNGSETATYSNVYGDVSHWDNRIPPFDQALNQHQSSQVLMSSQGFGTSSHVNGAVLLPTNKLQVYEGFNNSTEFGTSSQLTRTILPLTERDDDDFLESLLAPFGEDQTFAGI